MCPVFATERRDGDYQGRSATIMVSWIILRPTSIAGASSATDVA
jgi:hypothetical protein